MTDKVRILGVCASPRARFKDVDAALSIIMETEKSQDLHSTIYELASRKNISNTEATLWMSLHGAAREGASIDLMLLREFHKKGKTGLTITDQIREGVAKSDGVVFSTPVYFGDCSSYLDFFIQSVSLDGKVAGALSVGAKRNGGQETTNIYTLMTAMSKGAVVVGNGPPTSQYGGTGWAGDIGAILDDNFGLDTSLGTGKRVTEVARQMKMPLAKPAKITLIMSNPDMDHDTVDQIKGAFLRTGAVSLTTLNIRDYRLSPCVACSTCPRPMEENGAYRCILHDDMAKIEEILLNSDALVFVLDDTGSGLDAWAAFKVFTERTRYIRRNHFALADVPVCIFQKVDPTGNQQLAIKVVTYALRQNTHICGPMVTCFSAGGKDLCPFPALDPLCGVFSQHGCRRRHSVIAREIKKYDYKAVGYRTS